MERILCELSAAEICRYTSQIKLCEIGLAGQKKLKSASVVVVGAGGLGCASLLYLAAAGVGKLRIIDHDHVEMGNLQRQILYHLEDVGMYKCIAAEKKLSLINPHISIDSVSTSLTTENAVELIQDYDIVIDATDNFPARYAINDACVETSKPFIYGSIHHFEGQVAIFNVLDFYGRRGVDYRSLYPAPPLLNGLPSCSEGGVIAPLPGIIGSIQALEAIKIILEIGDCLSGKLLKIDSLTWTTRLYQIGYPAMPVENDIEIDAKTLQRMLVQKTDLQVIDLREESENALIHFTVLRVPFSSLMQYPEQITVNKITILICQKGIRSLQAAKILRNRTHCNKIYSLQGGFAAPDFCQNLTMFTMT